MTLIVQPIPAPQIKAPMAQVETVLKTVIHDKEPGELVLKLRR